MSPAEGAGAAAEREIFVTVGTTSFDKLIEAVDRLEFVEAARRRGYTALTLQVGRGAYTPRHIITPDAQPVQDEGATGAFRGGFRLPAFGGFRVEWFRYAPALDALISRAALVVSHAGAGSVFEALRARRPLLVAVNAGLMDNHQQELADALAERGHLRHTPPERILEAFETFDPAALAPYPRADAAPYARAIDGLLGFARA